MPSNITVLKRAILKPGVEVWDLGEFVKGAP